MLQVIVCLQGDITGVETSLCVAKGGLQKTHMLAGLQARTKKRKGQRVFCVVPARLIRLSRWSIEVSLDRRRDGLRPVDRELKSTTESDCIQVSPAASWTVSDLNMDLEHESVKDSGPQRGLDSNSETLRDSDL